MGTFPVMRIRSQQSSIREAAVSPVGIKELWISFLDSNNTRLQLRAQVLTPASLIGHMVLERFHLFGNRLSAEMCLGQSAVSESCGTKRI
jgi:hypothetical protein